MGKVGGRTSTGPRLRTAATDEVATLLQVMVLASGEQQSFRPPSPIFAGCSSGCGACAGWDDHPVRAGAVDCAGCTGPGGRNEGGVSQELLGLRGNLGSRGGWR